MSGPTQPPSDPWPRGRSRDGGVDRIPLDGTAGELWLCGKHAVGPDPERALAAIGATTMVCLTERDELEHRYPDYVGWLIAQPPERAVWFPIPDLHAPSEEAMARLLDDLTDRLREGQRLLVQCAAGIGRSGTLAACLLIRLGLDADTALHRVGAHRPMAGPEVGPQRALVAAVAAAVAAR